MLDMSKAFDSINRKLLIEHLQKTIDPDELHIVKKMLEVTLSVRCGRSFGKIFTTDTGAPQGDCASANSFTYYLAKSMPTKTLDMQLHDHQYHHPLVNHSIPEELHDHDYCIVTQTEHLDLDMEYADDMTKLTSDYGGAQKYEHEAEVNLGKNGLKINNSKTERFTISRNQHEWKKCKLLGTILDTTEDIKRRKTLAISTANNLQNLFNNGDLTINVKVKLIDTYIEPIFLYNSETWTLTKTMEESVDAFQRTMIRRYVLNLKWPKTISNIRLYEKVTVTKWSVKVRSRRLKWFSKVANLPDEVPARRALEYALQNFKRPRGKPRTTWVSQIKKDLENMNVSWTEAENICKNDKNVWLDMIKN